MITKMPLKDIIMFSKLSDQDLAEIAGALKQRRLDEGEVIFNLGDPGDELIIVEQGVLSIYVPVESKEDDIQPIRLFQAGYIEPPPARCSPKAPAISRIKQAIQKPIFGGFPQLTIRAPRMPKISPATMIKILLPFKIISFPDYSDYLS